MGTLISIGTANGRKISMHFLGKTRENQDNSIFYVGFSAINQKWRKIGKRCQRENCVKTGSAWNDCNPNQIGRGYDAVMT